MSIETNCRLKAAWCWMQSCGSYVIDVVAEEIARLWSTVIALSITSDSLSEIVDDLKGSVIAAVISCRRARISSVSSTGRALLPRSPNILLFLESPKARFPAKNSSLLMLNLAAAFFEGTD